MRRGYSFPRYGLEVALPYKAWVILSWHGFHDKRDYYGVVYQVITNFRIDWIAFPSMGNKQGRGA